MKLKLIGALEQVTGSATLLEYKGIQILVDFGLSQGEIPIVDVDPLKDIDIVKLKAVFLTHAHLDHCGLIPLLYKKGYEGLVITTKATSDLAPLIMNDSVNIGNTIHSYDDIKLIRWYYPDMGNNFEWQKEIPLTSNGISYYFQPSAHILGSVSIGICWTNKDGIKKEILFSGDIGNNTEDEIYSPLNNTLYFPRNSVDYLVCESTYGDRRVDNKKLHNDRINDIKELILSTTNEDRDKRKNIFIPAFSLHRTQELILDFYIASMELLKSDLITYVPAIQIDSSLGDALSLVYKSRLTDFIGSNFGEYKNIQRSLLKRLDINEKEIHSLLHDLYNYSMTITKNSKNQNLRNEYSDEYCKVYKEVKLGKKQERKYPEYKGKVIIASSGMMSDGPMKKWIPLAMTEDSAIIVSTGYQAEGTIGHKLMMMDSDETFDGYISTGSSIYTKEDIKCSTLNLKGYSAHADQSLLVKYSTSNIHKRRQIILNHGTNEMRDELKNKIMETNTNVDVEIPMRKMEWLILK